MTKSKVIIGGTIIDPSSSIHRKLNLFVKDGLITEVSSRVPIDGEIVIDAGGCIVAPGFIDMHVHLREPGQEHKEDISTGLGAAAAGGFTTICAMPNTRPVNDNPETTRFILERAASCDSVRVMPVGALTKGSHGVEPVDFDAMMKAGAAAFSDDGGCIQDRELMKRVLSLSKEKGFLVIDHAEDTAKSGRGIIHEGAVSRRLGLRGISRESENMIIERDIALAHETGARVHIAHVSTKEGVEMVRESKARGLAVSCEVTPHHLLLTENDLERLGPNAKMKPPLRTEEDRAALIDGLCDGTIDAIATDHAPHAANEKADLATAAFGVIGMETMLPVCIKLVHDERLTIERLIDAISCAPARILGLEGKGSLAQGAEADITVFSPDEQVTIDPSKFLSKARNTPFAGWRLKGRVRATIVRGKVVSEV